MSEILRILPAWERFRLYKDPSWRFDHEPHLGFLQGRRLWSITGALRQSGIIGEKDTRWSRPEDLIRGAQVHAACHYLDEGDLNWQHLEENNNPIVGYVRAWEAFKDEHKFVPRLVELPMYHPSHLYSGIPDREGLLDNEPVVLELKTGPVKFWVAFQTAGQDLLLQAWDEKPIYRRRAAVQLNVDGTYKGPRFFDDDQDYDTMRAAIRVAQAAGGIDRGAPPREFLD